MFRKRQYIRNIGAKCISRLGFSTVSVDKQGAHTVTRSLGPDLDVAVLGHGGAPLGDLYTKLKNSEAVESVEAAHDRGIAYYDTSPWYGVGLSESRMGAGLHGVPRQSFNFQTKVGRHLVPDPDAKNGTKVGWIGGFHMGIKFDYSAGGFEKQLEGSLQRTGIGYVDSLVIHDLEPSPRAIEGRGVGWGWVGVSRGE